MATNVSPYMEELRKWKQLLPKHENYTVKELETAFSVGWLAACNWKEERKAKEVKLLKKDLRESFKNHPPVANNLEAIFLRIDEDIEVRKDG